MEEEDPSCYVFEAAPVGASPSSSPARLAAQPPSSWPQLPPAESVYGCYGFRSSPVNVYHHLDQQDEEAADVAQGADADGDGDGDGDGDVRFDLAYQLTDGEPEIAEEGEEDDVMQHQEERTDGNSYVLDSDTPLRVTTKTKLAASAGPADLQQRQDEIGGSSSVVYTSTLGEEGESEGEEMLRQQSTSPRTGSGSASARSPRGVVGSVPSPRQLHKDLHWNEVFQQLYREMRARHREGRPSLEVYKKLSHHAHDFLSAAVTYGQIIISERYLANDLKTIKPVDMGGAAGGTKYVCRGILFKFSVDTKIKAATKTVYMYGGRKPCDEKAMKAGGHELKGLEGYFHSEVDELHCPLMVIIDFRGYRLTAMSTLPIGTDTLLYGSGDAGKSVKADNALLNEAMEKAGERLNLASHLVGDKMITGPGDIEGHLGRDGRFYVIDYSRTFPPEGPPPDLSGWDRRSVFYELLRPELVGKYPRQLSSDAFSNWQLHEPRMKTLNDEVTKARDNLHHVVIPQFAEQLKDPQFTEPFFPSVYHPSFVFNQKNDEKDETLLGHSLHKHGINARHLGRVRACLLADTSADVSAASDGARPASNPSSLAFLAMAPQISPRDKIKALLLVEMAARVIKNLARKKMRRLFRKSKLPSEEPYRGMMSVMINSVRNKPRFWTRKVRTPLIKKFGESALSPDESDGAVLRKTIKAAQLEPILIRRILSMLGISIGVSAWTALLNNPFAHMQPSDIVLIGARVKYQSVIDYSEGVAMYLEAKKQRRRIIEELTLEEYDTEAGMIGASPDDSRLLNYANEKLHLSLSVNTQHTAARIYRGCALLEMCKMVTGPMQQCLARAIDTFEECLADGEEDPLLSFNHGEGLCLKAAWDCMAPKRSVIAHPDMIRGKAILEDSLGLTETGDRDRERTLSYANTLYKDCKGFYTHAIVKGPRALPTYVSFLEFGVEMTDLVVRMLTSDRRQPVERAALALNESKGKGKDDMDQERGREEEKARRPSAELGSILEQQMFVKERRVRTCSALLGANLRFALGIVQTGASSALFAQGQHMIRDVLREEPMLAGDLLADCTGSLRRYKRSLADWAAPHMHQQNETEYIILRLRSALEALPTAGAWLSLREDVASKLAEAEEQARVDAEIAANSSSSAPPPPTFPRMHP